MSHPFQVVMTCIRPGGTFSKYFIERFFRKFDFKGVGCLQIFLIIIFAPLRSYLMHDGFVWAIEHFPKPYNVSYRTFYLHALIQYPHGPQTMIVVTTILSLKNQKGNLEIRRKWFSARATKVWNALPDYVREARTVNEFKKLYDIDQIKLDT